MRKILLIETATNACSIGLVVGDELAALEESHDQRSHAEMITIFSQRVMQKAGLNFNQLDAVAVSKGPGSYTGLRIGVSTAKGFCFAHDLPLIGIETLYAMAAGIAGSESRLNKNDLLCPMIDARRMEVYAAIFDQNLNQLLPTEAVIIDENSFADLFVKNKIWFFGDGAAKCRQTFTNQPNAAFLENVIPSASFMKNAAIKAFDTGDFEDVAYFEPFYLKDFVAGIPRVKGLR
ncbi:MAG: tRNA (adenosine(37)-N6)-threonylcarbamoyltransferase complex dimerization subunit type 1 TsaB [Bacteroidales bacterium]|nr:tRNA (adenosine(37)-N6)-threonylcarbamoyltransferase complex dimerization subunit type 1 TsaB [Bacteroidales bacterium]HOI33313.1 tRNA (adenosine(37)-N6)-threonylcarbamoyltransferase complex dimerization subunit type 1 TsaB [Bacteroidales bacterium]